MPHSPEALKAAFIEDVSRLLSTKYGTLPPNDLLNAFYSALNAHYTNPSSSAQESAPAPEAALPEEEAALECVEEKGRRIYHGKHAGAFIVAVEVFTPQAFAELTAQMRSRTLIAKIDKPMVRDAEFDVCVMLPVIDSELWMPGTVVSSSGSGLVFKVTLSSREVEVWQKAAAAFKSGRTATRSDPVGPTTSPYDD